MTMLRSHLIRLQRTLPSLLLSLLMLLVLATPTLARAGVIDPVLKAKCFPPGSTTSLIHFPDFGEPDCQDYQVVLQLVVEVVNVLIQFVLAIAFIFLIITGYQFITSVGDKAGMENAKRSLLYIIIGILAVLGSFMLVKYITNQFLDPDKGYRIDMIDPTFYV